MNLYHRTYGAAAIISDGFRLAITEDEPVEAVMFGSQSQPCRGSWSTRSAFIGFVLSGIGSGAAVAFADPGGMMLVPLPMRPACCLNGGRSGPPRPDASSRERITQESAATMTLP